MFFWSLIKEIGEREKGVLILLGSRGSVNIEVESFHVLEG